MPQILLIEADPMVRDSLRALLVQDGYEVLIAENQWDGFTMVQKWPVALVIADLAVPIHEDLALIQALLTRLPELKIVVTSTCAWDADIDPFEAALRAGVLGFFSKPFDPQFFLDTIARLLGITRSPRSARMSR